MTSYITVAEEEGAEPIELPTEEDGTGRQAVRPGPAALMSLYTT